MASLLERERHTYPFLVTHYDEQTRYIYPKGFRWWAANVYRTPSRVRPYFGFRFNPD